MRQPASSDRERHGAERGARALRVPCGPLTTRARWWRWDEIPSRARSLRLFRRLALRRAFRRLGRAGSILVPVSRSMVARSGLESGERASERAHKARASACLPLTHSSSPQCEAISGSGKMRYARSRCGNAPGMSPRRKRTQPRLSRNAGLSGDASNALRISVSARGSFWLRSASEYPSAFSRLASSGRSLSRLSKLRTDSRASPALSWISPIW